MTPTEMKYEMDLQLKVVKEAMKVPFITLDYSKLLTDSQTDFVLIAYNTFDRTELEKKVLTALVTGYSITSFKISTYNFPNSYIAVLPTDVLFVLEEHAALQGVTKPAEVQPVKYDYYNTNINNPFTNPYSELVWRLDFGGNHELITDGTAPTSYSLRYIARPNDIDADSTTDCQVNSFFHKAIVDGAVKAAIAVIAREAALRAPQQQPAQQKSEAAAS